MITVVGYLDGVKDDKESFADLTLAHCYADVLRDEYDLMGLPYTITVNGTEIWKS